MRREGFELTVGKPQVLTKLIDGKVYEPVERVSLDIPEEHLGTVTQLLAGRKGRMQHVVSHGSGWARTDWLVPVPRPDRPALAAADRDQGHGAAAPRPRRLGTLVRRDPDPPKRLLVADRRGKCAAYALINLQERGTLFVGPGTEVYEGMVVGENARREDMDINPAKERKLTNMRSSTAEELVRLTPHRALSLEQALEFLARTSAPKSRLSPCGCARSSSPRADPRAVTPGHRSPRAPGCGTRRPPSRWQND